MRTNKSKFSSRTRYQRPYRRTAQGFFSEGKLGGNRVAAVENGTTTAYTANSLNQYTAEGDFRPTYDADGNQTLIKTSTGIWQVSYNAKNRPVRFEKSDGSVVAECRYDSMGRRVTKKVTTNGTVTEHRRFLYRGYLQIAACDLLHPNCPVLWHILWDAMQPTATRPLAIRMNRTWYSAPARLAPQGSRSQVCSRLGVWLLKPHPAYGWDLTKSICELYRTDVRPANTYTYTPYGAVTPARPDLQPLLWSSEYHDAELGLIYYNYRHYNPTSGRWTGRDMLFYNNLYRLGGNAPLLKSDYLGLWYPTRESSGQARRVYVREEGDTKETLAKEEGLDVLEFDKWAIPTQGGKSHDKKLACSYSVPNTWIQAQLLPTDGVIQLGGLLGGLYRYVRLFDHKVVIRYDVPTFLSSFNNDTVGFVVYAHGYRGNANVNPGTIVITVNDNGEKRNEPVAQEKLMSVIRESVNFRLRDARLLQCYGMRDCSTKDAWFDIANNVYGFTDVNFCGFNDTYHVYEKK